MKILISGFSSFLDNEVNPTEEIIKLLPKSIYGNELIKVVLPVVYRKCFDELLPYIKEYKPKYIINLGLAGGRKAISFERVAINIDSTTSKDNEGNIPVDKTIELDGKNAYFSTLPFRKMIENLKVKKIPAEVSNSAGTYVCNNLMYNVLRYIDDNNLDIKAGFIHVPFMSEQVDNEVGSIPLDILLEGIIDAIKACVCKRKEGRNYGNC